jgi:alpha-amylase
MYVDGVDKVLNGRTPNSLYRHPESTLMLIPRNYQLSDDVAFRYSDQNWAEWPLTGRKFESWLSSIPQDQRLVSLAMDYETFGEHKKASSGIFGFLGELVSTVAERGKFVFVNPSDISHLLSAEEIISSDRAISWADEARDLSAWLGNDMQRDAFGSLYRFHDLISSNGNPALVDAYRHLQTSDHFYYMATKNGADGTVHQYFSPYSSPYEAFMNFMNIIADLELQVKKQMRGLPGMAGLSDASLVETRHPSAL